MRFNLFTLSVLTFAIYLFSNVAVLAADRKLVVVSEEFPPFEFNLNNKELGKNKFHNLSRLLVHLLCCAKGQ